MTYQETIRRPNRPSSAARIPQFRQNDRAGRNVDPRTDRRNAYAPRDNAQRAAREREYYDRLMREERRKAAAAAAERRRLEYIREFERRLKEEKRAAKKRERAEERVKIKAAEKERAAKEVKVARTKISFSFIAVLLISALMIMAVIFSYAQVSAVSRQISEAKNTLDELKAEEEDLVFALEQKNDVRLIEKIATEKIGMVKEGAVTKRFISLSEGDSIELEVSSAPEGRSGAFGSVLSAIAGFFDNIRDYVR